MAVMVVTSKNAIFACNGGLLVEQGGTFHKWIEIPINKSKSLSNEESNNITCLVSSLDECYIAAATYDKRLLLYNTKNWTLFTTLNLKRRAIDLAFDANSDHIFVADKTGDVYRYFLFGDEIQIPANPKIEKISSGQQLDTDDHGYDEALVLGHLSMLLSITCTSDGRYVITSDRDEKIRVSCYPNTYNIHTFLLGHTECVTQTAQVPHSTDLLLSGSGDSSLRLWNLTNSQCLKIIDARDFLDKHSFYKPSDLSGELSDASLDEEKPEFPAVSKIAMHKWSNSSTLVAVIFYRVMVLHFYEVEGASEFRFLTSHKLKVVPFDIAFTKEGELVLLKHLFQKPETNPISVLSISREAPHTPSFNFSHPLVTFASEHLNYFKNLDINLDIDTLYKQKYDNMTSYLDKKEKRMASSCKPKEIKKIRCSE